MTGFKQAQVQNVKIDVGVPANIQIPLAELSSCRWFRATAWTWCYSFPA